MNRREFIAATAAGAVFPVSVAQSNYSALKNPFDTQFRKEIVDGVEKKWIMTFRGYDGEVYALGVWLNKENRLVDCDYKCLQVLNQAWRGTLLNKGWIDEVPEWRSE